MTQRVVESEHRANVDGIGVADGRARVALLPRGPVSIQLDSAQSAEPGRSPRVVAVIPCYNRAADAERVLADLADVAQQCAARRTGALRVILVDNGSTEPLERLRVPSGLEIEHLRLESNVGGSGGFNAGIRLAVDATASDRAADFLWLVDSDARVHVDALDELLGVMSSDWSIVAAGAAVHDPDTGQCFELAGRIDRRTGAYGPAVGGSVGVRGPIDGDYVAAACALVRAEVVRRFGVMPDRFINGDDVEWFIRLRQASGGRVVGVPSAVCWHPRFSRFPTWQRYYTTRNAIAPLAALGLGRRARLRRALGDVGRAAHQELMQRHDLAELHLAGLRDASVGRTTSAAAEPIHVEPMRPALELVATLRELAQAHGVSTVSVLDGAWLSAEERAAARGHVRCAGLKVVEPDRRTGLSGLLGRLMCPYRADVVIAPSRGCPNTWGHARWVVQVANGSFVVKRAAPAACVWRALRSLMRGIPLAWKAASRRLPGPTTRDAHLASSLASDEQSPPSIEAVILSYNRKGVLLNTIERLLDDPAFEHSRANASITVVDNGSTDGSVDEVRERFPSVRMMSLTENLGVEAFNQGACASRADVLLILDDDAVPAPGAVPIALARLARDPCLGAVVLHPHHPATGASEWPFAANLAAAGADTNRWPLMGCANVVRRSAWEGVGGYEGAFFLYRNDADLALRMLEAGWGVHFDPALVAWHATPSAPTRPKSLLWHELATRNWIWMARRNGHGPARVFGAALGWMWSHKLAGARPDAHAASIRGLIRGIMSSPPPVVGPARARGSAWRAMLALRLRGRVSPR